MKIAAVPDAMISATPCSQLLPATQPRNVVSAPANTMNPTSTNTAPRLAHKHAADLLTKLAKVMVLCSLLVGVHVQGAVNTRTWISTIGSGVNWGTAANWVGVVAPVSGDNLIFNANRRLSNNNNTLTSIGTLAVANYTYIMSGNSLTLGGGWTIESDLSWGIDSTLGQALSMTVNSAPLTLTGTLNNNGYLLTLLGAPTAINFNGVISGTEGLTANFSGSGAAVLSVANSYSGLTTISAGKIQLGVANAIPRLTSYANNYIDCAGAGGSLELGAFASSW